MSPGAFEVQVFIEPVGNGQSEAASTRILQKVLGDSVRAATVCSANEAWREYLIGDGRATPHAVSKSGSTK
jgi:hypothetical protein